MNTADKQELLKKEILDDADKRVQTIIKRAERDAKKTQQEAEKKAADVTEEALKRAAEQADRDAQRILEVLTHHGRAGPRLFQTDFGEGTQFRDWCAQFMGRVGGESLFSFEGDLQTFK